MQPPENLTTSTIDTSTTSKHFSSTIAKRQGQQDDNAHSQSVSKHHQQVGELDVSCPGFRKVPANVTRITAGTRSAAAPPPNQPQAAPLDQRRPPTRKSKKKNRLGDNSDSGSESDNTNRLGNNDDYSASRRPEAAPEVPGAVIPAEYPRHMRQKGFDWMLRLKKAGQTCQEFHHKCAKNREIGWERLEKLANDPRASQPGTTDQVFTYPSADLRRRPWNNQALRTNIKIWESRRRAHFDKVLYSYFQASLGNDCPMETPIDMLDMLDTLQGIVEAVEAEMVHCLGHFDRYGDFVGTNSPSRSTGNSEVICHMIQEMHRIVVKLSPAREMISGEATEQTELLTATNFLKQKVRAIQVPETSPVGQITRAYIDKIISLMENDYNVHQTYVTSYGSMKSPKNDVFVKRFSFEYQTGLDQAVRSIINLHLKPIEYLSWILDTSDKDSLLVHIRGLQWEQNQELRDSYRIRQEMFYPGDSRPGFGWSVLWSWDQPKIFEEFSQLLMARLGWFYENSEEERYVQYQLRSAYLDAWESTDEVILKVSMTKDVIGMYLSDGRLLPLDGSLSEPEGKVEPSPA